MANTKIVLNRQSDLILDNALITNPQGIVLTDISGVSEAVASINSATSADLSAESSARAAAIDNEQSARVAGDESVTEAMSAEISTRVVAETSLQNNIDAEASTGLVRDNAEASMARAAEQSVATDLIAEQSRAESAELSLNTKVEFVISNTDVAALDSLTEIVSAFQSADGDINGAITALGSAATVAVDNEASIRLAADQSLAGDLSSEIADREAAVSLEEAARISGDSSLELELSAEIEARISDVNEEQARAESVEASLDDAKLNLAGGTMSGEINMGGFSLFNADGIDGKILSCIEIRGSINNTVNVVETLDLNDNKITNVLAPTNDGDATNKLYVDTADLSLAADLSSEVLNRANAVDGVVSDMWVDKLDRIAADLSIETILGITGADNIHQAAEWAIYLELLEGENVIWADQMGGQYATTQEFFNTYGPATLANFVRYRRDEVTISLSNSISTNVTQLYNDISSESIRATDIENTISSNLSTEVSDRVAGDQSLQNQIDFITNNTDAAAIDSLTEIVAAFQSADGDINNAITNLADAAGTNLSTEVARAESAEASLDAAKLNLAGGFMGGDIDMGGFIVNNANIENSALVNTGLLTNLMANPNGNGTNTIINLPAPTNDGDATNKLYVDSADASVSAELSISVSDRVAADESLAAELSSEIESLALTDEETIELNTADNTIKLKDTVAAPASGIRTFMGEVDVETILKVAGVDVMATLSSEVARAESAEASIAEELSSEVSYIIANTDLSSIDSFAEVVADMSSEISRAESAEASIALDFANIYAKRVGINETPDDSITTFTLGAAVREGSELVYLNGLSLDSEDYTPNLVDGKVASVTFFIAPSTGDKVRAYGVY
jgi:hypothetical protein